VKVVPEKFADAHLKKAERIVLKKKRHPTHKMRATFVFWSSIVVVVCANLLVSSILVPFLTILDSWFFDVVTLLIALIIGIMYAFLLLDVAHLERSHKLFAGFFVPFIATANAILLWNVVVDYIAQSGGLVTRQNPWMVSVLYGAVFAVPYVLDLVKRER
jgi:hypothetical protein